jgi:16S rRNA processing protein RimM
MTKNQCFELGYIERIHGYSGSVVARFDVDDPSRYNKIDALFVETESQFVPYLIEKITSTRQGQFVIQFQDVKSEEQALKLKGSKLFLPEQFLPNLKPGQYFYHELVGAKIVDEVEGELGLISEIFELPQQTLASMHWNDSEVLIPVHENIVVSFDRKNSIVKTRLPEGLLDVYLKPTGPVEGDEN